MESYIIYDSPIGTLYIGADDEGVTSISTTIPCTIPARNNKHSNNCLIALREYFVGNRSNFSDIKISPAIKGTEFQKRVWHALTTIPIGATASYGEIAAIVGSPKASRAVGGANHNNPIPIIVPCHRVIGKNGALTGFGLGLNTKKYLLDLEQKFINKENI